MPYISQEWREKVGAVESDATTAGELNYEVTTLLLSYLARYGQSYALFNEVVGVLECAKLELYRRMIVPYESTKCTQNGDVYP